MVHWKLLCILSQVLKVLFCVILFEASILPFKESNKDTTDVFNSQDEI